MRKAILLTAAAAFLAVPAVLQAQTPSDNATIQATATVQGYLDVTNDGNLAFGNLAFGEDNPHQTPGRFKIVHNEEVSLYFQEIAPLAFEINGEEYTIAATWTCGSDTNETAPATLEACGSEPYTIGYQEGRQTSYFHVGGSIEPTQLEALPQGDYVGTLRLGTTLLN